MSATWKPALALTAGNTIYQVHVEDQSPGVGLYTVTTGSAHPAGQGLNVLFGGGNPSTTFNTIRSYSSSTDYVQSSAATTSANTIQILDSFGTVASIGTTGLRTTYALPGLPATPDALTIISDVNVRGTTVAGSTVEVTTSITNNGSSAVAIGVRYLWDVQIGSDDGPTFQEIGPNGTALLTEAEFTSPGFVAFKIEDNDTNPTPPTFFVFGTVTGPGNLIPSPTAPDLLQVVCWPLAVSNTFEYTISPQRDIAVNSAACSTGSGGDSAVLYFFGYDAGGAIQVGHGERVREWRHRC